MKHIREQSDPHPLLFLSPQLTDLGLCTKVDEGIPSEEVLNEHARALQAGGTTVAASGGEGVSGMQGIIDSRALCTLSAFFLVDL